MKTGATYLGVARNAPHGSWLHSVLDRASLIYLRESGQPLFEQDLATCIQEHVREVLDQLDEMDATKATGYDSGTD